jgi:hypothetical protein
VGDFGWPSGRIFIPFNICLACPAYTMIFFVLIASGLILVELFILHRQGLSQYDEISMRIVSRFDIVRSGFLLDGLSQSLQRIHPIETSDRFGLFFVL